MHPARGERRETAEASARWCRAFDGDVLGVASKLVEECGDFAVLRIAWKERQRVRVSAERFGSRCVERALHPARQVVDRFAVTDLQTGLGPLELFEKPHSGRAPHGSMPFEVVLGEIGP